MMFEMVLEMALDCGAMVDCGQGVYDIVHDEFDCSALDADALGALSLAVGFEVDGDDLYAVLENLMASEGEVVDEGELHFWGVVDGERYVIGHAE